MHSSTTLRSVTEGGREVFGAMVASVWGIPPWNIGAMLAATSGAIAALIGVEQLHLLYYVLVLMGLDLISGLLAALILPTRKVDWRHFMGGMLGKMLLLTLVAVAQAVDHVVGSGHATVAAVLIGLITHEGASIVQNVVQVKGGIQVAVALLRQLDVLKSLPEQKPNRRHYDNPKRFPEPPLVEEMDEEEATEEVP